MERAQSLAEAGILESGDEDSLSWAGGVESRIKGELCSSCLGRRTRILAEKF